jgi:hypothetical protein
MDVVQELDVLGLGQVRQAIDENAAKPMMELRGVRSSWLMVARNWLFMRSASRMRGLASASALVLWSSTSHEGRQHGDLLLLIISEPPDRALLALQPPRRPQEDEAGCRKKRNSHMRVDPPARTSRVRTWICPMSGQHAPR